MFIDEVKVKTKGGDGGNGIVAWRREPMVDRGGPFGGNGGHGGDVIFRVDSGESTLLNFRYKKHIYGKDGERGKTKVMHGKNAEDILVKVPEGTTVYDVETGMIIADLTTHGQEAIIARGGRGGRGNAAFVTPKNFAPEVSELGGPGEEREVKLELKVLADVGLVGFPSVGKSTLISAVSAAKPKVAAYHFTTLAPNLGVVAVPDERSFVMADLPGIIEGASQGAGLGLQFLKHIERTRVIVHVIDMSGQEGRDPYDDYKKIDHELVNYKYNMSLRPQIIVANKMDLPESQENLIKFKEQIGEKYPIIPISAYTRDNLNALLYKVADVLETAEYMPLYEDEQFLNIKLNDDKKMDEANFEITLSRDNVYEISGELIDRFFRQTNFDQFDSIAHFSRRLRQIGVDKALRAKGVKDGDVVRIQTYEFEYID